MLRICNTHFLQHNLSTIQDLALYEDSDSDSSLTSSSDTETTVGPINENNIKIPGSCLKSNLVEIVEDSQIEKEKCVPV